MTNLPSSDEVKAGLSPRLSEQIIVVYVEATPDDTESRLLRGLRKHCPGLAENVDLKDTLAELRRGQGIPVGKNGATRCRSANRNSNEPSGRTNGNGFRLALSPSGASP